MANLKYNKKNFKLQPKLKYKQTCLEIVYLRSYKESFTIYGAILPKMGTFQVGKFIVRKQSSRKKTFKFYFKHMHAPKYSKLKYLSIGMHEMRRL